MARRKPLSQRMKRDTPVKSPQAARTAIAECWGDIKKARSELDKAAKEIGQNTKWAGRLARLHKSLHRAMLDAEEIYNGIKEE